MSIVVTRFCDKCKKEVDKDAQLWNVDVSASSYPNRNEFHAPQKSTQVCRPCLESFGIHVITRNHEEPPKAPSISDLVLEIIRLANEVS
jgi:hypothetical protein